MSVTRGAGSGVDAVILGFGGGAMAAYVGEGGSGAHGRACCQVPLACGLVCMWKI